MPQKDPEERKEYMRKYSLAHKERHNETNKNWYWNNLERGRAISLKGAKKWFSKPENKEKVKLYKKRTVIKINVARRKLRKQYREQWYEIIKEKNMHICSQCGYSKCFAAIDFHHPDPNQKDIAIAYVLGDKPTEERISKVLNCIPLCANCHRELHFNWRKKNTKDVLQRSSL